MSSCTPRIDRFAAHESWHAEQTREPGHITGPSTISSPRSSPSLWWQNEVPGRFAKPRRPVTVRKGLPTVVIGIGLACFGPTRPTHVGDTDNHSPEGAWTAYGSRTAFTDTSRYMRGNLPHSPAKPAVAVCLCGISMCMITQAVCSPTPMTHESGRKTAPSASDRPDSLPGEHHPAITGLWVLVRKTPHVIRTKINNMRACMKNRFPWTPNLTMHDSRLIFSVIMPRQ